METKKILKSLPIFIFSFLVATTIAVVVLIILHSRIEQNKNITYQAFSNGKVLQQRIANISNHCHLYILTGDSVWRTKYEHEIKKIYLLNKENLVSNDNLLYKKLNKSEVVLIKKINQKSKLLFSSQKKAIDLIGSSIKDSLTSSSIKKESLTHKSHLIISSQQYIQLQNQTHQLIDELIEKTEYRIKKNSIYKKQYHITLYIFIALISVSILLSLVLIILINKRLLRQIKAGLSFNDCELKFKTFTDNSPNMVFIIQDGDVVYVNNKCVEISGFSKEEFYDEDFDFMKLVHTESIESAIHSLNTHKNGEDVSPLEYSLINKSGKKIEVIINTQLITFNDENAILGIVTDITHNKQTEDKLRHNNRLLASAESVACLGSWELDIPSKQILWTNETYQIHETTPTEFVPTFENYTKFYVSKSQQLITTAVNEAINKGKGFDLTLEVNATENKHIDIRVTGEVIFQNEHPYKIIGLVQDISKYRNIKKEIKTLSTAVEQSSNSIVITNVDGSIEYVNDKFTELTGYTQKEVIGKNPRILNAGTQPKEYYTHLWQTITKGKIWTGEFNNKKKNGDFYWEFVTITPIKDEYGEITNFLAIKENVTSRKENERFLSTLINNLNGVVYRCLIDKKWTMLYLTDQILDLTGYTISEVLKNNIISFYDIIYPEDRAIVATTISEAINTQKEFSVEYRIVSKNGTIKWVLDQGSILVDEKESFIEGIIYDITHRKESSLKLLASESSFRNLFDTMQSVVTIFNKDGKCIACNKAAFSILKLNSEEKQKITLNNLGLLKDIGSPELLFTKVINGYSYSTQLNTTLKDNSTVHLIVDVNKMTYDGNPAMLIVGHDVTDKMKTQFELEKSEEKYRYITENSIDIIWQVDHQMRFTYISPSIKKILGYTQEKWLGKTIDNLMLTDDFKRLRKKLIKPINYPHQFPTIDIETEIIHNETKETVSMEVKGKAVFSQNGDFIGFLGTSRDVSLRNAMISALKENIALYKAIFGNTGTATCITSGTGEIILANKEFEKLSNLDSSILEKSMSIFDFIPSIISDKKEQKLQQLITHLQEFDFINSFDTKIPVILSIQSIEDSENYVISLLNISKRKEIEKQLQELNQELEERVSKRTQELEIANNAKSEFLANMNHEIRTPINAILGFAELLEKNITDQKALAYLESILVSGKNLLSLINNTLDLSQAEAGKLNIIEEPVDIYDIIKNIKQMFEQKAELKNIKLIFASSNKLQHNWRFFSLDSNRLKQILINLINNAIKFTYEGSVTIQLNIKPSENKINTELAKLEIIIKDTGIGIPENSLKSIYEPFTQLKNSKRDTQEGTGIGLSICLKLVKLMNGELNVESIANIGSKFTVTFDNVLIIKDNISSIKAKETTDSEEIIFNSATILIVDDMQMNREYLKNILNNMGFNTCIAKDGLEALNIVKSKPIDLIITDLKMPVKDGFEFKKELEGSNIPIIASTAMTNSENLEKIKEYNFSSYLLKPFTTKDVHRELIKFLPFKNISQESTIPINPSEATSNFIFSDKIISRIKESALDQWINLQTIQRHVEVFKFGEEVVNIGNEFNIDLLKELGQSIIDSNNIYDVQKVQSQMKEFGSLLKENKIVG